MLRAALVALLLSCSTALAVCGPDKAPAPAAAHGFTCEVFWDDFTSSSTVDLGNTRAPGFKWYINNRWPGLASGYAAWQNFNITNPSDIAFVAGGMRLTPSSNTANDGVNMMSCATTGVAGEYVGTAIKGGMYIDVQVTSISPIVATGAMWWTALWSIGTNFLTALDPYPATTRLAEVDFLEINTSARMLHEWQINHAAQDVTRKYYDQIPYANGMTIGTLILPPELNGGTGTVVGYENEVVGVGPPVTWAPGGLYSTTTTYPQCFIITSGYNQAVTLRSWKVFAAPPPALAPTGRRRRSFLQREAPAPEFAGRQ